MRESNPSCLFPLYCHTIIPGCSRSYTFFQPMNSQSQCCNIRSLKKDNKCSSVLLPLVFFFMERTLIQLQACTFIGQKISKKSKFQYDHPKVQQKDEIWSRLLFSGMVWQNSLLPFIWLVLVIFTTHMRWSSSIMITHTHIRSSGVGKGNVMYFNCKLRPE